MSPIRLAARGSAFDRRLVSAARAEAPVPGAEERALARLGLSALAGAVATPPVAMPRRLAPTFGWALKSIGVGLAALAIGGASLAGALGSPHAAPPRAVVAAAVPEPVAPEVTTSAPPAFVAPPPAAAPAASASPRAKPRVPAVRATWSAQESSLSGEVALVQEATRALARRDEDAALRALNQYARAYPHHGILARDAAYLRVRAMLAKGDRGAALDLARRLLAAEPNGVLAPKLKAIVESEPAP